MRRDELNKIMPTLLTAVAIQRIDDACVNHSPGWRGDSQGVFFQRQIEVVLPEILRAPRAPMDGMANIPIGTSLPAGAESWVQRIYTDHGVAKLIANWATDFPTVELQATEERMGFAQYGIAAEWTVMDLLRAQLANVSIDAEKMRMAVQFIDERFEETIWTGEASKGLKGIFAEPNIPRVTSASTYIGMAADTLLANLNSRVNAIVSLTKGRVSGKVFSVMVDLDLYGYMSTTPRSSTSDTTILDYWLRTSPYVREVIPTWRCKGSGTGGTNTVFIYQKNPSKIRFEVNATPRPLPVEVSGGTVEMKFWGSSGGLYVPYPLECCIIEYPQP